MLTKFPRLATSGRQNSAMATDTENALQTDPPYWMSNVNSYRYRINSKSFPWDVRSVLERYLPKFSATSDVRYCVFFKTNSTLQCMLVRPIERYIEEKQTELKTENT